MKSEFHADRFMNTEFHERNHQYKFTIPPVNGTNTIQSLINIVKEERIQKKEKRKYDIISFLDHCMKGWMSEVALNFQATFCVSGLLTTENNDFIYYY